MPKARIPEHRRADRGRPGLTALGAAALLTTLTACAAIPADADGTLERVSGGELRVGVTHSPPWTDISTPSAPTGREVQLAEEFAESIDADIVWTAASEATIADGLRNGAFDLGIGGFTDDTPWTDKAAMTTPYDEEKVGGQVKKHVMLTVLGENRLLSTLETFLLEQEGGR